MDMIASHNAPRAKGMLRSMLLGMLILAATFLIVRGTLADFATPFMEINNKVGDVSEAHGYVVALGDNVEECKYYLVIVGTDTMEHIVIKATADKNVVKESLVGRQAIIKAEVTARNEDTKTKRVVVQLKILSVRSSEEQKGR